VIMSLTGKVEIRDGELVYEDGGDVVFEGNVSSNHSEQNNKISRSNDKILNSTLISQTTRRLY